MSFKIISEVKLTSSPLNLTNVKILIVEVNTALLLTLWKTIAKQRELHEQIES